MNNEESAMLDFIGLNNPIESSSDSEDQTTQQTPPPENTQSRMFDELGLSSNPEPEAPVAEEITPTEDPTERSLSDVGSDILVGLGKGSNQLLDIAGSLYGLKTGNFDNAASRIAQENLAYYEQRKSEGLLAREDQLALDIKNEEGLIGKGMAAFVGTVSDPALLGNFITEQLPMLAATAGTGALAGAGAKIAGAGAKGIATSATAGAIGGGAVMQGASVGGEVHREYEDFLAENPGYIPVQDEYVELLNDGMTEDEARAEIGLHLARTSALEAGAISLIVQRLPGAATLDKALAGVKLNPGVATSLASRIGYAAKGAVGEGVSEAIEEGSGAFIGNTAESTYNEDVDLLEGVGEAAGYGAASFVFGGAGGLSQGRATDESAANSNEESTTPHQDALEEHGGPAEGLDELALLAEQEAAQQKLPSDDVATDISEDDRANLDSSEYINELNSFVNDDSNYNDVFDEVDEIVGLEDFTPTVDDIDGLSESDLAPEDPSFSEDDSAQEQQLSEEQRQAEYENSHAQTTTRSEEQDVDFGNFDESVPSVEVNGTQRRVSVTSQEDSVPPEGSEEKRTDLSRRERIAALTPEEVEAALYKNELTGIENRRSFEEQVVSMIVWVQTLEMHYSELTLKRYKKFSVIKLFISQAMSSTF